jgi:hypothetical protein
MRGRPVHRCGLPSQLEGDIRRIRIAWPQAHRGHAIPASLSLRSFALARTPASSLGWNATLLRLKLPSPGTPLPMGEGIRE